MPSTRPLSSEGKKRPAQWVWEAELQDLFSWRTLFKLPGRSMQQDRARLLKRLAGRFPDRVLDAIARTPREDMVPTEHRDLAYRDGPLRIGHGQTISQPTMVAIMTQALNPQPWERVLEVGAGSGYQAAVLARLAAHVVSVERVPELAQLAARQLDAIGLAGSVTVRLAGDCLGCPEEAPFDAIMISAAAPSTPQSLFDQLTPTGRLLVPVGTRKEQRLLLLTRTGDGHTTRFFGECRFVPLIGPGAWSEEGCK